MNSEKPRSMYLPMEALNTEMLSKLGNVRLCMVPKQCCEGTSGLRTVLDEDSDWMIAEKNYSRSSPGSPWRRLDCNHVSNGDSNTYHKQNYQDIPMLPHKDPLQCRTHYNEIAEGRDNARRRLFSETDDGFSKEELLSPGALSPESILSYIESTSSSKQSSSCQNSCALPKRQKLDDDFMSGDRNDMKPQCTCSKMADDFLQMTKTAYENIRRNDRSPASFNQFQRELCDTNSMVREALSVLNDIQKICKHKQ